MRCLTGRRRDAATTPTPGLSHPRPRHHFHWRTPWLHIFADEMRECALALASGERRQRGLCSGLAESRVGGPAVAPRYTPDRSGRADVMAALGITLKEVSRVAKFLIQGSYTAEGAKGLIKEGGTGRRAAIEKSLEGLGGKLESFYFTYGTNDVNVICDIPDAVSGLALSLAVNSSGAVRISTTPLLSVEDVDAACKKAVTYRPAGA